MYLHHSSSTASMRSLGGNAGGLVFADNSEYDVDPEGSSAAAYAGFNCWLGDEAS